MIYPHFDSLKNSKIKMKYLKGYKLLNESESLDEVAQSITDRLVDLKDLGANIYIGTWQWNDLNGYIEIINNDNDIDKRVYCVRIDITTYDKYSKVQSAYVYDDDCDRDGDKVSEVNVESIHKSAKVLGEVANFISMAKGEGWLLFMDDSDISSKSIRINFFIIPNKN